MENDGIDKQDGPDEGKGKKRYRIPRPGQTKRPHRLEEARRLLEIEVREAFPHLSDEEITSKAEKRLEDLQRSFDKFESEYEKTAPTSTTPPRSLRNQHVELAAVLRLGPIQFLWMWMLRKTRPGPRPQWALTLALLCHMVFFTQKPDVLNTLKHFHPSAMRDFIYGSLAGCSAKTSTVYNALQTMLLRDDPQICWHVNLALFKRLIGWPEDGPADGSLARGAKHPDAGRYLMVDGSGIPAHVPQRPARYVGDGDDAVPDPEHEALLRRGRKMATWSGEHYRMRGYKIMLIADMATGLPLIWKLYPLTVSETKACRELLAKLFALWPDCPAEYLVGDNAYDTEQFTFDLVFRWGLHPVFTRGENKPYGREHKFVEGNKNAPGEDGVPKCRHGLMKLHGHTGFVDANKRAKRGLARGEMVDEIYARLQWKCRGQGSPCGWKFTYPRKDARIYTWLPRAGDHRRASLRAALRVRRNSIESIFAQLKGNGQGGNGVWRAFWAEDGETEWLIALTFLFFTAKRVVAENGRYEAVYGEAEDLGLLDLSGEELNDLDRARLRGQREERSEAPQRPATFVAGNDNPPPISLAEGEECLTVSESLLSQAA